MRPILRRSPLGFQINISIPLNKEFSGHGMASIRRSMHAYDESEVGNQDENSH